MGDLKDRRKQLGTLVGKLDEELKKSDGLANTIAEIIVKGPNGQMSGGGRWLIVVEGGSGCVQELGDFDSPSHKDVQCKVSTDIKTVSKLANGEMKPAMAVLRGRISYSGDYNVFRNLQAPFRSAAEAALKEIGPENLGSHLSSLTSRVSQPAKDWSEGLAFILDESHPEWVLDAHASRCKLCLTRFGFLFRRHHCRLCGSVVCAKCSNHWIKGNRVCSMCFQNRMASTQTAISTDSKASASTSQPSQRTEKEKLKDGVKVLLPHEQLMAHVRALQDSPIGAAIEAKTMSILASTRRLLLKLRKVETTVEGYEYSKLSKVLIRAAVSLLPMVALSALLSFSWRNVISSILSVTEGQSSTGSGSSFRLVCSFGALVMFSHRTVPNAVALAALGFVSTGGLASFLTPGTTLKKIAETILPKVFNPNAWMVALSQLLFTRPILFPLVLFISLLWTLASRYFGRLLQIYATAFSVILSYYFVYLICIRIMKMPEGVVAPIFTSLDRIMAPFVCDQILQLRSVFVKFGQYIGSRADIIPPHWGTVLAKLQDDMPADSPEYVERCIKESFGHSINEIFESFDYTPMASASVAQVHRAVIRAGLCPKARPGEEGRYVEDELEVAVKVQHEGIVEIMLSDVVAFRRIIKFIAWLNPRFGIAVTLLMAWEKEMLKELDFRVEAGNLFKVRDNLRQAGLLNDDDFDYADSSCSGSQVLVPKPIHAFVAKTSFCMTFIHGFKISDLDQLDLFAVDRCALVKRVVQAYSNQLYIDGFFNADPHPGNVMVCINDDGTARPVLLDFGMVVEIPHDQRIGYSKLVHSISGLCISGVAEAISEIGYKNSQSEAHPERDLEFFSFLLRDTGDRKSQRAAQSDFHKRRQQQRKDDLADDPTKEGRFFSDFPDSLIFLFRVLGLIRGLCATLDTPISYIDIMGDYARLSLVHEKLRQASAVPRSLPRTASRVSPPSLSSKEITLQGKIEKILTKYSNAGGDSESLGKVEGFEVESFLGAQVCVYSRGNRIVDTCAGVLDELGPSKVSQNSVFPLLDLSRIVPLMILYRLQDAGTLDYTDKICKHWPSFYSDKLTIANLLSYSAKMEDVIPSTASAGTLRDYQNKVQSIESCRPPFLLGIAPDQARYQVYTFGYALSRLIEKVVGAGDLFSIKENMFPSTDEVFLSLASMPNDQRLVRAAVVSNGFAGMLRGIVMSGKSPTDLFPAGNPSSNPTALPLSAPTAQETFDSSSVPVNLVPQETSSNLETGMNLEKEKEVLEKQTPSRLNGKQSPAISSSSPLPDKPTSDMMKMKLPSGIMLDPCCVNFDAVRNSLVPSFGSFGSARGLCELIDSVLFKSISKRSLSRLCESRLTQENSPLFGEWEWSFGLQVYEVGSKKTKILCHHSFGGSIVVIVPDRQLTVTVLVNCLTLDRSFTKEVVGLVLSELDVPFSSSDLFKGMF